MKIIEAIKRIRRLRRIKAGNEQQITAIEIGLILGRKRKERKDITDEEKWAIAKKMNHMEIQKQDFIDALKVINYGIKNQKWF